MSRSLAIIVSTVALLVAGTAGAADTSPQAIKQATKFYAKGERAFKTGNMEQATVAFHKSLEAAESFPEAHIGLGHIAMAESRFDDALRSYESARDGYGELGEALFKIRSRRYTDANNQIRSLRDQINHLSTTTTNTGMANFEISKLSNAINQLQAIEAPSRESSEEPPGEIFFYIGNALFQLSRVEEGVSAWEACRDKSPEFPLVYNNLALAYMRTGRLDEANVSLARAEELGFSVNPQFKQDLETATARSKQ